MSTTCSLKNLNELLGNLRNWSVRNLFSSSLRDPVLRHGLGGLQSSSIVLLRRLSLHHDRYVNHSIKELNLWYFHRSLCSLNGRNSALRGNRYTDDPVSILHPWNLHSLLYTLTGENLVSRQ